MRVNSLIRNALVGGASIISFVSHTPAQTQQLKGIANDTIQFSSSIVDSSMSNVSKKLFNSILNPLTETQLIEKSKLIDSSNGVKIYTVAASDIKDTNVAGVYLAQTLGTDGNSKNLLKVDYLPSVSIENNVFTKSREFFNDSCTLRESSTNAYPETNGKKPLNVTNKEYSVNGSLVFRHFEEVGKKGNKGSDKYYEFNGDKKTEISSDKFNKCVSDLFKNNGFNVFTNFTP